MEISLQTSFYFGLNVALGAFNLYKNAHPQRWLTAFAVGVLVGTVRGSYAVRSAEEGYNPGNRLGMGWNQNEDKEVRERGVQHIINSMPGFFTTAIQAIALAVLTQSADFLEPYGSRYEPYINGLSAFSLGYTLAYIFALDNLRRSKDPAVKSLIAKAVV